jgi:uncharacterized membrane protein
MALFFRNQTNRTIFVALGYSWQNCPDGDNWAKKGWWRISPGGTATVRGGASNGAKYFWHAHTDNGVEWAGPFNTYLPSNAFDWCWPVSSTNSTLRGMQKLIVPTTSVNHTIVLQFA